MSLGILNDVIVVTDIFKKCSGKVLSKKKTRKTFKIREVLKMFTDLYKLLD